MADLHAALGEAEERWQRHTQLLGVARDLRIRGPEDPFTAAQELGHHAHWLEYARAATLARFEDAPAPERIEDEDAANARWAAEDAALPFEDALARCTRAWESYRDAIVRLAGALPEQERLVRGLRGNLVDHFDQHWGYLVRGELAHESVEWERLTALLDARPEGVLHSGEDGQDWTARDIYTHLERWMTTNIPRVQTFASTGAVPDLPASVDELNARWIEQDRDVAFPEARRRAFLARDRFADTVRDLPAAQWTTRIAALYHGNARGHYLEHLDYIDQASGTGGTS